MRAVRRSLKCYEYETIAHKHVQLTAKVQDDVALVQVTALDLISYTIPEGSEILLGAAARGTPPRQLSLGATPNHDLSRAMEVKRDLLETTRFDITILSPYDRVKKVAECCFLDCVVSTQTGRKSILPTRKVGDLGRRLWRPHVDENGFCIDINERIQNIDDIIGSNEFRAIAIPEITRWIALQITSPDCPVAEVQKEKWMTLFQNVFRDSETLMSDSPEEWADAVANAFTSAESLVESYLVSVGEDE